MAWARSNARKVTRLSSDAVPASLGSSAGSHPSTSEATIPLGSVSPRSRRSRRTSAFLPRFYSTFPPATRMLPALVSILIKMDRCPEVSPGKTVPLDDGSRDYSSSASEQTTV